MVFEELEIDAFPGVWFNGFFDLAWDADSESVYCETITLGWDIEGERRKMLTRGDQFFAALEEKILSEYHDAVDAVIPAGYDPHRGLRLTKLELV